MNERIRKQHFAGEYANCVAVTTINSRRNEVLSAKFHKSENELSAYAYAQHYSEITRATYRVNRVIDSELWCVAIFNNGKQIA